MSIFIILALAAGEKDESVAAEACTVVLYMANLNIAEQYMRLISRKSCTLGAHCYKYAQYPAFFIIYSCDAAASHEKRQDAVFIEISARNALQQQNELQTR